MPFRAITPSAVVAIASCTVALAQAPQASTVSVRTVIAATKLANATDKPLQFRALSITLPAGGQQTISTEDGILYQLSGSVEISVGAESSTVSADNGMFIAGGKLASLNAMVDEPSTSLYFEILPAGGGREPAQAASANVKELFRTAQPIAGLKPGGHDLNMTRVIFPAQLPANAPHHRTGAALYYIISGTGANTVEGKTEMKGPGSFIYEPGGLVHQWANPGASPMAFLTFNINQEGMPAVAADTPAKSP